MRKTFIIVLVLLILSILCMPAFATENCALSFVETQSQSGDITFTVSVSAENVSAVAVTPVYDTEDFELVDGQWLLDSIVDDFSRETGDGVIALAEAGDISSEVFRFTLRKKTDAAEAKAVTCSVILLNTEEKRIELTAKVQPKDDVCEEHIYGSYTANSSGHRRICTKCGKVQLSEHIWDEGEITKAPTQNATGTCTYTCSVCDYSKEETVPALTGDDYTTPSHGTGETEGKVPPATDDGAVTDDNGTKDTTPDKKPSGGSERLDGNEPGWIVAAAAVILVSVLAIVLILRKKR